MPDIPNHLLHNKNSPIKINMCENSSNEAGDSPLKKPDNSCIKATYTPRARKSILNPESIFNSNEAPELDRRRSRLFIKENKLEEIVKHEPDFAKIDYTL